MDLAKVFQLAETLPLPQAAMSFASNGVSVFPCVRGAKAPLTSHGFHDSTVAVGQVAWWWQRNPEANIGVATGSNGFDVIDVDRHPTGSGFGALVRAKHEGLIDGWHFAVRTPSGGLHLYYPADPDRPQQCWGLGDVHIDFRGTGGYVIAPPSKIIKSGASASYQLVAVGDNSHPIDAAALRQFLHPSFSNSPAGPAVGPVRAGHEVERIVRWLERQQEGSRNRALFWASCRFAEGGIPEGAALKDLKDAAAKSGLPEREIETTVRSAYRGISRSRTGPRIAKGGIGQ